MKKYLIIGGAGFIGSHLSEALSKKGHKVAVIDNFSTGAFAKNNHKIKTYKTNVDNLNEVEDVFSKEKPDFVFHLAGAINLRRSDKDPLFVKDMNFLARTKIVLDVCRDFNVKKLIFISSGGAIYENAKIIPTPEDYLVHPASLYGLSNLVIEKYIQIYCDKHNLNFVIPRLSNVYGPRQWKSGVIPSIIINLLGKKPPVIFGRGDQTRDFIYIDDVVEALIILAEKGNKEIYNVGTDEETSLKKIFELVKGNLKLEKIGFATLSPMMDQLDRSALSIEKIKEEFGWRPKTSIKEGLAKTIEWYGKNKN